MNIFPSKQPPSEEEKDYIKEFGDGQKSKNLPDTNKPPQNWNLDPEITNKEVKIREPLSMAAEDTIKEKELKDMVTESVLNMMNSFDSPPSPYELLEEQKQEILKKIQEYCKRGGIMSIALRENFDKDESTVHALIDPTNRKNWMQIKEEVIYKLPYSYKDSLHTFAKEVWNRDKGI